MAFYAHELGFWEPQTASSYTPSYPDGGNALCFSLEAGSHWFGARNRTLEWAITKFRAPGAFIDVGGGNGYQLHYFQQGMFRAINLESAMCEPGVEGCINASKRGVRNVFHCAFDEFPITDFKIGNIGLFDVVEHIRDDSQFLTAIAARCERGTRIFITVPALRAFWSGVDVYAGHFRRYDGKEFHRLVCETGLKPVFHTYFFSYYAPFVWVLRNLIERFRKPFSTEEIIEREGRFHGGAAKLFNPCLSAMHTVEMALLRVGARLPFGTSMLMVFEKP